MLKKAFDTADIVREAIFRQLALLVLINGFVQQNCQHIGLGGIATEIGTEMNVEKLLRTEARRSREENSF